MLPTRLNVGCGRDVRDGWVNLDITWHDGMVKGRDIEFELGGFADWADPLDDAPPSNHFTEIEASHVVEHVPAILLAVEQLWTWAANGCQLTVRCPHGSSDDAWEDPTHVREMYESSFMAWSQGYYWRADYGYRGDWALDKVTLHTKGIDVSDPDRAYQHIQHGRNFVIEMVAELHAVKPARPPVKESQDRLNVVLV